MSLPIAVFDSGIGGLTVVAALRRLLPQETLVYLGDTARLPYGNKSPHVVRRYALKCARFLQAQGAKLLVMACNTATAYGLDSLQDTLALPVIGVIEPGAQRAVEASIQNRIGIIGTEGTIASGCYSRAVLQKAPQAHVYTQACPLLAPLVEEGLLEHQATWLLAQEYLAPLVQHRIDTLVLGCTHYPLLMPLFQSVVGHHVRIIDSATAVAQSVQETLETHDLKAHQRFGPDRFFATDVNARLQRVGHTFLGRELQKVELVDI